MAKATEVVRRPLWYTDLVDDVRKLEFAGIVATKHAIGQRVLDDWTKFGKPTYGGRTMATLARDTEQSQSDLYYCVAFARKYPELSNALENLTWRHIVNKELPKPKPNKAAAPATPAMQQGVVITADFAELLASDIRYRTVYADPPWQYGNQRTRAATSNHYATMDLDALKDMPVEDVVADDALLFLWTTGAFLHDAMHVIEAWGFEYKTEFVWVKPQMGLGNYLRMSHEPMLIARRGTAKAGGTSVMSWLKHDRARHSVKPAQVRKAVIETLSQPPYLELFAREIPRGWSAFGNEVTVQARLPGLEGGA